MYLHVFYTVTGWSENLPLSHVFSASRTTYVPSLFGSFMSPPALDMAMISTMSGHDYVRTDVNDVFTDPYFTEYAETSGI